ncbi:MAG: bifunctional precorrin-2 dehydrogenase/sirohydrochlorin ferrochelatase [Gemmatimonadaceae bacterium]
MSGLPILLEAAALRVLVVGGGAVATRKTRAFCEAGAQVRVIAPTIADDIRALQPTGRVALAERPYHSDDIADAQLVIAATDDRAVNARVAADARAASRLVNVTDLPAEGSFATMATHRSGGLVIGVTTGGVPDAAARIRDAIAERFDSRYARALADLADLRRSLIDRGDGLAWRALAKEALDARFCESVERASLGERVATWR